MNVIFECRDCGRFLQPKETHPVQDGWIAIFMGHFPTDWLGFLMDWWNRGASFVCRDKEACTKRWAYRQKHGAVR